MMNLDKTWIVISEPDKRATIVLMYALEFIGIEVHELSLSNISRDWYSYPRLGMAHTNQVVHRYIPDILSREWMTWDQKVTYNELFRAINKRLKQNGHKKAVDGEGQANS